MEIIANNFVPLMFAGLLFFLLTGFPVAFALAATGLFFGFIGMEVGLFPSNLFQALPLRVFGIMQNDTLLAIPFFTLMGIILERSRMAEDLLETVAQVFGPVRGGLAVAVVLVGALLAATTGVVAAAVISMGLISLPIMLRYGYNRTIATGTITASGTLAQAIPPSLVLIVLADQLGRSVGDMYQGALLPGLVLTSMYVGYVALVAVFRPSFAPAMPPEARTLREPDGASGLRSLALLTVVAVAGAWLFASQLYRADAPRDEVVVVSAMVGIGIAFVAAMINRLFGIGLLSRMAERVTFVLIPPLGLIFLVLGTIFIGVATPTEGGAMGALGAVLMALGRRRLSLPLLKQAMESTTKLSCFVIFILIGSSVFGLTFRGVNGDLWVEHLMTSLPGGQTGFLVAVNLLVFVLAFFLDYFELAFIIVPLLAPVADKLGIDLIWFGVLLAVNMQTSFLHPPFGFALFFLRSVASEKVKTASIYWGAVPFVIIQLIMVGLIIAFPGLVSYGDAGAKPAQQQELDLEQLLQGGGGAAPAGDSSSDLMRQLQGN